MNLVWIFVIIYEKPKTQGDENNKYINNLTVDLIK